MFFYIANGILNQKRGMFSLESEVVLNLKIRKVLLKVSEGEKESLIN